MLTNDHLVPGTHKGLLILEKGRGGWDLRSEAHLGVRVPYAAVDQRTGTLWASLDHGHRGCKLHRSTDGGASSEEVPAPKYPEEAKLKDGAAATLRYI